MFKKYPLQLLVVLLSIVTTVTFTACSNSSSGSNSYSGPGSKWDMSFTPDGFFTTTKAADSSSAVTLTVNGTYTDLSSGFKKLTVTSVAGTDGPAVGDTAYGLEVPGYVFLMKPLTGEQLISMVVSGTCPTGDMAANWVMVNVRDGEDVTNYALGGIFNLDSTTSAASLPNMYSATGTNVSSESLGTGTCADGLMTVGTAEMFLTSSGGAIVNTNAANIASSDFVFGFAQVAVGSTANLNGDYAGVVYNDSATSGNKFMPVNLSCTGGVCTGYEVTNVETGATSTDGVTLTLTSVDNPSTGFVLGTIQNIGGGTTGNVICIFDTSASKTIGSCAGQDPGDTTKLFNVLLASK